MNINGKPKLVGEDITAGEVIDNVLKDMAYYRRSGGGLTLSGGECLMQADFAKALLSLAKESGISTAIESEACVKYQNIQSVLPYLDTYLCDLKHVNSFKHKQFTGVSNELILENIKKLNNESNVNLVIRIPVVPTFNDTEQEITEIAKFIDSNLSRVKKVHLLPYHRLGQDKYSWLNREYQLKDILPPTNEHMNKLKQIVQNNAKVVCVIGG